MSTVVAEAQALRTAAKVRALSRGPDTAGAITARVTGYVARVHPALEQLAAVERELDVLVGEPSDAERFAAACRRQHHAIAAVLRAHRGEPQPDAAGRTCTCDNSLGSSVACRGAGRLGEGWCCALTGERGRASGGPAEPERVG